MLVSVEFLSSFNDNDPNHANLANATVASVNEKLTEFCEAQYSVNGIWTGGATPSTPQAVATTVYATRIGNRVNFNIDSC